MALVYVLCIATLVGIVLASVVPILYHNNKVSLLARFGSELE